MPKKKGQKKEGPAEETPQAEAPVSPEAAEAPPPEAPPPPAPEEAANVQGGENQPTQDEAQPTQNGEEQPQAQPSTPNKPELQQKNGSFKSVCEVCKSTTQIAIVESQILDGKSYGGLSICQQCIDEQPTSTDWKVW
eukprot:CAMPEP_0181310582 /NCGR_PEP_ID=MMETSP1101-20121128/12663_1 /TAXON_ID=46948 /ORGANISM="Rhodomonas abbreviata, Strain Caron Lab Isolate" /LENGTH=136 /DNA_ID=CAMNT_0023417221 /DNA_START=92 /DNA_END=499 /DNA_ORIENTATION=+